MKFKFRAVGVTIVLCMVLCLGQNVYAVEKHSTDEGIVTAAAAAVYDTTLMAFQEFDQDFPSVQYNQRANYFLPVTQIVQQYRHATTRPINYTSMPKQEMINVLTSTKICFIHTHGAAGMIQIGNNSALYTFDLDSVNLNNLTCVLLLVCRSGATVASTSGNMVQKMVSRGADSVIGFTTDIAVMDSNLFAERFADRTMRLGLTVAQAVSGMSVSNMSADLRAVAVIGGNSSTRLTA